MLIIIWKFNLLIAGKSLTDFTATLDSYGIRSGARVMVLESKVSVLFTVVADFLFVLWIEPMQNSPLCIVDILRTCESVVFVRIESRIESGFKILI